MAKKSPLDNSSFDAHKLTLLAERKAQNDTTPISDEDVCIAAERQYRAQERRQALTKLITLVRALIRENESEFTEQCLNDFSDGLKKCADDVERLRICYQWTRMYRALVSVK